MKKIVKWLCQPVPDSWLWITLVLWAVFAVLLALKSYP